MSEDKKADASVCCASCGIAEIDDIKLTDCGGCDLVKYCSDECQRNHTTEHKEDCNKRAAELRVEILFKQPESTHLEDCPICSLPLSLDRSKSSMYNCCSKLICKGCSYANRKRQSEMRLEQTCPFCREPLPENGEETGKRRRKRLEANDPLSMCQEGIKQYKQGDYTRAFEYWSKAAELGDADAHFRLAWLYQNDEVVEKDERKEIHHLEEAVIAGHPIARFSLGCNEWNKGNIEKAVKHWVIAATQGQDDAMKKLMDGFRDGYVSKEKLTATLRAYQAAVDATKSPQRKEAEECFKV